jgi:exonuclease III
MAKPPPNKRLKAMPKTSSPQSIVTWNCNGFVSRCKGNSKELKRLLVETKDPDCICLQEVRLKACSQVERSKPMASEYEFVKPIMEELFNDKYDAYWSLADTRYAGTLTLLHKRLNFSSSPGIRTAFTPQTAITVLCQIYGVTREQVGLPAEVKAPPQPTKKKATQKSMTSFFTAAKPKVDSTTTCSTSQDHNSDGRFQCFFFPDMHLVQTYVPNNGMKEESFARRRAWDADMLLFVQQRHQILHHDDVISIAQLPIAPLDINFPISKPSPKYPQLLWCGDMNCASEYEDGTHWEDRSVGAEWECYEWWTDESKCLSRSSKKPDANRSADDIGMPSFTPGERNRFYEIKSQAGVLDIWRELHKEGSGRTDLSQWDRPEWTWRGHLGVNGYSKYEGKGQRLDYFLLSVPPLDGGSYYDDEDRATAIAKVVEGCEILGYGAKKEGLFCGSDHCASILLLKDGSKKDETTSKATAKDGQEGIAKYLDV